MSVSATAQYNNVVFKDINWLNATGGLYNGSQVLEYFYRSPFFDKSSDNEALRMQGVGVDSAHLSKMKGIQYICDETLKNPYDMNSLLYVVKKIRRNNERNFDLLDLFYCIDGEFYKAPDFYELVKTRYSVTAHHIKSSFNTLVSNVQNSAESTVMFPAEQAVAQEKIVKRERAKRYHTVMTQFPSMSGVYNDLDLLVEGLVKRAVDSKKEKDIERVAGINVSESNHSDNIMIGMNVKEEIETKMET